MKQRIFSLFKYVFMLSALMALVSSIVNVVSPWEGEKAAGNQTQGYISLAIGGSLKGSEIKSRSYALIPVSFSAPKMLYVSKTDTGSYKTTTDQFTFWLFGTFIMYGWYLLFNLAKHIVHTERLPGGATKT